MKIDIPNIPAFEKMNAVVDYIEDNLDKEINYDDLAKIMTLSIYEFRRIFSFIAGVPVSEYVRNRRLSKAVFDIQSGKYTISEITSKYGYDSQSSFSRAFREMHGISPTEARAYGVILKTYPKLTFRFSVSGTADINFKLVKKDSFIITGYSGVSQDTKSGCCEDIWERFYESGIHTRLLEGGYYSGPLKQAAAYRNLDSNNVLCIVGAELKEGDAAPEGAETELIPASLWAIFPAHGIESGYINEIYSRIFGEWIGESIYRRNTNVHTVESFPAETGDGGDFDWEIWIPITDK